jgi:tripartite-type tricarboxylate transporter receptor subunit TctC
MAREFLNLQRFFERKNVMHLTRRTLGALAVSALTVGGLCSLATPVGAQEWPTRPVRMINPFAAGSAVDVVARLLADRMSKDVGQQFLVDNRTGASGNIGTEVAARSKPDGYTFLVGSPGTMAINPALFDSLPYDAIKDFVPVSHLVSFPQVLVVNPKIPVKTVAELIAWVNSQQGKVNYASSGRGSTSHLVMELIRSEAKLQMTHIPYRGGSPAIQALIGGEVQLAVEVTSEKRAASIPDVPALSETYPGFDAAAWVVLFAPTGTPTAVVDRMAAHVKRALAAPDVLEKLGGMGATAFGAMPAETAAFHKREMDKFKRAVDISGAKNEK